MTRNACLSLLGSDWPQLGANWSWTNHRAQRMRASDWLGLSHMTVSGAGIDKNPSESQGAESRGRVGSPGEGEILWPEEERRSGGQTKVEDVYHTQGHEMIFMGLKTLLSSSIKNNKHTHIFKIVFYHKDTYNPGWITFMFSSDFRRNLNNFGDNFIHWHCTYCANERIGPDHACSQKETCWPATCAHWPPSVGPLPAFCTVLWLVLRAREVGRPIFLNNQPGDKAAK